MQQGQEDEIGPNQSQGMMQDPSENVVPPTWEELGNRLSWAVRVSIARAPVQDPFVPRLAPPMLIIVQAEDLELRSATYELDHPVEIGRLRRLVAESMETSPQHVVLRDGTPPHVLLQIGFTLLTPSCPYVLAGYFP